MTVDEEQSIWDHLEELATRLRRVIIVIVIATVAIISMPSNPAEILKLNLSGYRPLISLILEYIQDSLLPDGVNLIAFNWLDTFYIYFMVAFVLGMLVTMPYMAFELYQFIAPALYPSERSRMYAFIVVVTGLFTVGALYAWFILLPTTFRVLYNFVYQSRVLPFFSIKDFYDMVSFGLLGSGLFYTFPVIIYFLVAADLIMVQTLKENRKQLFLALLIITAVFTPDPTPFSMLLMSIPFYILYEITIQVLSRVKKEKKDPAIDIGIQASREMLSRQQDPDT
ncbi:preprotein translocase subunit TatC [Candidatus Bathyarchaeota archaeon]|nr:preprotein translocase subunit TatC [Candidatus Bathyarchaeota archaeon]